MAQAVQELFPDAHLAIGPAIEDGFYYDFDLSQTFEPDDLAKIEGKMAEIVARDLPLQRAEVSRSEAHAIFAAKGEKFKLELIEDIADDTLTVYSQGDFVDLCRGPHLPSTGGLKAFKLLEVAGAYWRGSEKNPMLQRIYGTAFPSQEQLDDYLRRARGSEAPGPPPPRPRPRSLQRPGDPRRRPGAVASEGRVGALPHRGVLEEGAPQARL